MAGREKIGFKEAFSIGVGGMIGGGIFAVLGLSLQLSGTAAPLAFLIAGAVAFLTSYSYAKLSLRYPSRGGTVEFLVRAYGTGIASGGLNVLLLASYIVMIALYAFAFGSYGASSVHGGWLLSHLLATLVIAAFVVVNAFGAVVSGDVEDALVFFKLSVLILVAVVGIPLVAWSKFSPSTWPAPTSIIVGGMVIFLAYEGFELIANAAADVESPEVLPKAFYASVAVVIAVYVVIALVSAGVLSPQQVIKARDYALAEVAAISLGEAGFLLVVAAALASTASAINATLYGTAGISYVVAKYGQLPREVGRRIWRKAPEGLVAIAVLSALLVNSQGLEAISVAGSSGFLLIFLAVNLAAYKLRRETKANPALTLAGAAAAAASLAILLYRTAITHPHQALLFAGLAAASFAIEAGYRAATHRSIAPYIDYRLKMREEAIRGWRSWLPRAAREAVERLRGLEAYLVGGVARGELHSSHDVDLLVVAERKPSRSELRRLLEELRKAGVLEEHHPLHIHVATPEEKEKWLRRSRAYQRIYRRGEGEENR